MESAFRIFTDGSVIWNPESGGWAAVLMIGDKSWEMSGSSPWTTISEMELLAAVEALRSIPTGSSASFAPTPNFYQWNALPHPALAG